ncbi:MAG: hypothetical protein J6A29_04175 [Clostridia bacterium]|nr:hypothetical protein [Clostridia bacterium]
MIKGVLVFLIVITIMYLAFSIWNTFITNKQVTMSVIDIAYGVLLGSFTGLIKTSVIVYIVEIILVAIWLMIVSLQWNKNHKEKYLDKV